jgi:hypothetical protein
VFIQLLDEIRHANDHLVRTGLHAEVWGFLSEPFLLWMVSYLEAVEVLICCHCACQRLQDLLKHHIDVLVARLMLHIGLVVLL